jgi:hypothetical protein
VGGDSGSLNWKAQATARLYTHPDRDPKPGFDVPRFLKKHDIYSLGVVLLEVGRLRSFMEDSKNEKWSYKTPSHKLKENFSNEASNLQTVLGKAYREVVGSCLGGQFADFASESVLTGEFRSEVCDKLDQIKISLS